MIRSMKCLPPDRKNYIKILFRPTPALICTAIRQHNLHGKLNEESDIRGRITIEIDKSQKYTFRKLGRFVNACLKISQHMLFMKSHWSCSDSIKQRQLCQKTPRTHVCSMVTE